MEPLRWAVGPRRGALGVSIMAGPNRSGSVPLRARKGGAQQLLQDYALTQVKKLDEAQVLAALKEDGITDLQGLVRESLKGIRGGAGGGSVARTTFIYEQFIYKESLTLPDDVMEVLKARLR